MENNGNLKYCETCGMPVSDDVSTCPYCGDPIPSDPSDGFGDIDPSHNARII